ncbi:MAG: SAM-dependent methyltransferase [Cytophagales bacterium]|nr:SAM-dependent methyltransferase [Cytophagales bacterium]
MDKDFIVSLTKYYRKFRNKDKSPQLFSHFLAVLALRFVQETQGKQFFKGMKPAAVKSINGLWSGATSDMAQMLDTAVESLTAANEDMFGRLFQNIRFDKLAVDETEADRDTRLAQLVEDIASVTFGQTAKAIEDAGLSVGYLIEKFTEESYHKEGFLYTPRSIGGIMVQMARLEPGQTVYDPAVGIGTLLVQAARTGKLADGQLSGQDVEAAYVELARFHLFFNGIFNASLETSDSLARTRTGKRTYDCILAQPPFREKLLLPVSPRDFLQPAKRRKRSVAYAENTPARPRKQTEQLDFLTHTMESLNDTGKAILIVPHGLLFKSGVAYQVRRKLVEGNLVEAVVDLPPHVFYSSKINAAILLLNKNKKHNDTLFIDASGLYDADRRRNKIRLSHSKQVMDAFKKFTSQEGLSCKVSQTDLGNERNNYNLTAKRYVQQHDIGLDVNNLKQLMSEIEQLEQSLNDIQGRIREEMAALVNA